MTLVWALYAYAFAPRRALLALVAAGALWALLFASYLPDGIDGIAGRVLFYTSNNGIVWGIGALLPHKLALALFGAACFVVPLVARRRGLSLNRTLYAAALTYLVFAPGLSIYHLMLVMPFAVIYASPRWLWTFGALGVVAYLISARPDYLGNPYLTAICVPLWAMLVFQLMTLLIPLRVVRRRDSALSARMPAA